MNANDTCDMTADVRLDATRSEMEGESGGSAHKHIETVTVFPLTLDLFVDETQCVYESVYPTIGTDPRVVWTSSDESVASVDPDSGLVRAHRSGVAKIIATARDGGGAVDYCVVDVHDFINVENIWLYDRPVKMRVGDRRRLFAKIFPFDATVRKVTWWSSDERIAKVEPGSGVVIAKRAGIVTIGAVSRDGTDITATCTVHVKRQKKHLRARYWKWDKRSARWP